MEPVGLSNLGNTCFMNAGVQCILNTPTFVSFIADNQLKGT